MFAIFTEVRGKKIEVDRVSTAKERDKIIKSFDDFYNSFDEKWFPMSWERVPVVVET